VAYHRHESVKKGGWCWWYRKYASGDVALEGLENDAREAKKGLWADPAPDTAVGVEDEVDESSRVSAIRPLP